MPERDNQDQQESDSDAVPAKEPTDEEQQSKDEEDAAVDEASEQSMDGSDAPPW